MAEHTQTSLIVTESVFSEWSESAESTTDNQDVNAVEYSINEVSFQIPTTWILETTTDTMLVFSCLSDTNDRLVIRSETIPDFMKVDAGGGNAILSKEDLSKYYGAPETAEITDEYWAENNGIEYYEQYFSMIGKLSNGDADYRTGRSIIIPINQTEACFSVLMLCAPDEELLREADIILDTIIGIEQGEASFASAESETYKAYYAAINLTKADLRKRGDSYYYRGIPLLYADCDWIDNPINTEGRVKQTAMYIKMGTLLEFFSIGNDWENYAEVLIGFVPKTRDEMIPYVDNASEFVIYSKNAFEIANAVMHKFETLSCTTGTYDYAENSYQVDISDVSICAEEMMISEEMLGYIIAAFNAMGADISFENNACSISVTMRTLS